MGKNFSAKDANGMSSFCGYSCDDLRRNDDFRKPCALMTDLMGRLKKTDPNTVLRTFGLRDVVDSIVAHQSHLYQRQKSAMTWQPAVDSARHHLYPFMKWWGTLPLLNVEEWSIVLRNPQRNLQGQSFFQL